MVVRVCPHLQVGIHYTLKPARGNGSTGGGSSEGNLDIQVRCTPSYLGPGLAPTIGKGRTCGTAGEAASKLRLQHQVVQQRPITYT